MGKITSILSIFKSATSVEKIAKAVEKGRMPSIYAEDLAKVENSSVREALTEQLANVANKTSHRGQMKQAQINDITWKLELCDDVQIKTLTEELLIGTKGKSRRKSFNDLFKAEHLLDTVNAAKEKYCEMLSHETPLGGKFINTRLKKIQKYRQNGEAEKLESELQYFERTFSEPRKICRLMERRGEHISKSIMKNESQFASLREFIEKYPQDKETATYLWKKYFVSTQEPKFKKIMNEIYDKYGVRTITNNETKLEDLIYLKKEFEIYKTASKGKAKFPALFDIREDYYIQTRNNAGAYTNKTNKIVNPARYICTIAAPRHEMAHMQENVLKRKKVKINENDRQELLNAGIDKKHTDYFFKNEEESWAVFAEGDMSKYSEEFKQKMINKKKGLPAWITSLTPNSFILSLLKANLSGVKNERMLDELYARFGDDLFMQVSFLFNQRKLELGYKLCKKLPKDKQITVEEFDKLLQDKIKHTHKCKQEAIQKRLSERMQKLG